MLHIKIFECRRKLHLKTTKKKKYKTLKEKITQDHININIQDLKKEE